MLADLVVTVIVSVQTIIEDPLMRHSAILVFANKQDMVSVCAMLVYLPLHRSLLCTKLKMRVSCAEASPHNSGGL